MHFLNSHLHHQLWFVLLDNSNYSIVLWGLVGLDFHGLLPSLFEDFFGFPDSRRCNLCLIICWNIHLSLYLLTFEGRFLIIYWDTMQQECSVTRNLDSFSPFADSSLRQLPSTAPLALAVFTLVELLWSWNQPPYTESVVYGWSLPPKTTIHRSTSCVLLFFCFLEKIPKTEDLRTIDLKFKLPPTKVLLFRFVFEGDA